LAKKKTVPSGAKKTRKVLFTVDAIRAEAAAVLKLAEALDKIAEETEGVESKSLMIEGRAMLDRSKKYIKHFILNAQRELA